MFTFEISLRLHKLLIFLILLVSFFQLDRPKDVFVTITSNFTLNCGLPEIAQHILLEADLLRLSVIL